VAPQPTKEPTFGEQGVILVAYHGTARASLKSGALPALRYVFSAERNEGYIDARDWPALKQMWTQDGGPLFSRE